MTAVQITGCSGAGKTTIAAELARRGLAAIDADGDPLLARSVNAAGIVVEEPEASETPDFAWLSRHSWAWDPARLDELIRAAAPATLYVCGGAAPGRPAVNTAWMPHPCCKSNVNAASTPYAGRLRGLAAGLMRPAGQAVRPGRSGPGAWTPGRPGAAAVGTGGRPAGSPSLTSPLNSSSRSGRTEHRD